MYETCLLILKAANRSVDGVVRWTHADCQCAQLQVGDQTLIQELLTKSELDLVRSAISQLVSLGYVRREGESFRITDMGRTFAKSLDLPEDEI